jgi:tetratricopeptide (TPR) repeat protein
MGERRDSKVKFQLLSYNWRVDLDLVRRYYPLGSEVIVHLQGGKSARGKLEEIDGDSLVLAAPSGPVLLLAGAVQLVEAISVGQVNSVPAETAVPEEPVSAVPAIPADAWEALTEEFALVTDGLELSAPDFHRDPSVPLPQADAATVDRELDRASSLKPDDAKQVVQVIRLLTALADQRAYPPAYHLAALLALRRGGGPQVLAQAARWMTKAASLGGDYARDLAIVCLRSETDADAATALGQALGREPAAHTGDPVLRCYVRFWAGSADPSPAIAILAAGGGAPESRHAALRAGLFLLRQTKPERADTLAALLLTAEPGSAELAAVLRALERDVSPRSPEQAAEARAPAKPAAAASVRPTDARPADARPTDARLYVIAARAEADRGRPDNAIQIAKKGLNVHPGNQDLLGIVEMESANLSRARTPSFSRTSRSPGLDRRKPQIVYSSNSLYAQAGRAETVDKDLVRAESLYWRAIETGDSTERAVRSLAWLLHRLKRSIEALELLRDPQYPVREVLSHQNMIITILGDLQRWAESAQVLEEALQRQHTQQVKIGLLKRLIFAYQKSRDWDQAKAAAKRLLTIDPASTEFKDIVAELDRVQRTGVINRLDELLADTAWNPEQSRSVGLFLAFHLDNCEYAGVSPARVQSQQVSERDVRELERLIKELGTKRSADRAAYNLSEARILRDLNLTEDDRFRRALRGFAAAMGDLCAAERRSEDVTRAYYTEAVALGGWDEMGQFKVRQFVLSYHPNRSDDLPDFESCMTSVVEVRPLRRPLLYGLLGLANGSKGVGKEIVARTFQHKELQRVLYEQINEYLGVPTRRCEGDEAYAKAWQDALRLLRRQTDDQRRSLQVLLNRAEPLDTLTEDQQEIDRVASVAPTSRLDSERLSNVSEVMGQLRRYLEQTAYLEQERLESMTRTALLDQIGAIEANPTRLSLEYLVPLLAKFETAVAAHFQEVQKAAEPTHLEVELVLANYQPGTSTMQVQLAVTNPLRRSPAVDVTLWVVDNPEDYEPVHAPIKVAQSLRDGQSVTCALPLTVTGRAAAEQVLTLRYSLEFMVRSGHRINTDSESLSLRLSETEDWQPIVNPYAEGAPVMDENMFYGRDPLIDVLVKSLAHSEAKSVIIYGQKRAGKSSVLYHLQRKLKPPLLPVRFSLLELATSLDQPALLYKIARAFYSRLEDLADDGYPRLDIPEPRLKEFTESSAPQILFDDYMADARQRMQKSPVYQDWRLVLLLDEFTMLYSAILRGDVLRGFMKSWKAMLESNLFSSVVVGNDLMPAFLAAFPNEFQVARQERVSYLDGKSAELLITEPVLMEDGENRYRGDSVARILELTARSPYYIQLFCNRLIEHMNAERQALIGPADVDKVAATLGRGDKALLQEQFDNLLTPGDADVSGFTESKVLAVLHACLTGHRRDLHLDGRRADAVPDGPQVLADLERRDVIVREGEERYRIKVGLFAEWLWDRKA